MDNLTLKKWLNFGKGVGIIEADYYNKPEKESENFIQKNNLNP